MNPTLPLNQFTTLVKVQQQNGVFKVWRFDFKVVQISFNGFKFLFRVKQMLES